MMNDNETAPGKRFRLKFSHILIILLIAGAGAFAYYRLSLKSKLQARIDAVRAAGYPVTCAELDKWYTIPENTENAAYTIIDAFSYYKKWDKAKSKSLPVVGRARLPARTEPLAEEMKALIAQYVADNNEALELLHAGATIEHCRYPIDLSGGFGTLAPNLSEIRRAVQLLKLEGILHAENGDGRSAVRSAISGFGIARSLAGQPTTISQRIRAACQDDVVSTVERVINRMKLTDEQLVELIECVRDSERISDISCALVGHRCAGISFLRVPESVNPDYLGGGVPIRPVLALYKAVGIADADAVIYLDLIDGYFKSTQLPLHRRQDVANSVSAKLKATSKAHLLLHAITPMFSRNITIEMRTIAHLRTAQVALALQRYRLSINSIPDKLTDLVPAYLDAVPTDPFDGNEMRYKKLEVGGFVVYSIGEDLSDDDGKEKPPRRTKESPNWDVTFIVER